MRPCVLTGIGWRARGGSQQQAHGRGRQPAHMAAVMVEAEAGGRDVRRRVEASGRDMRLRAKAGGRDGLWSARARRAYRAGMA